MYDRYMRKIFFLCLIFVFIFLAGAGTVYAQNPQGDEKQNVIVFVRSGCAHCRAEEEFLKTVQEKISITLEFLNIADQESSKKFAAFTERTHTSKVTPITVIGNSYIIGFDSPETTGKTILELIDKVNRDHIVTSLEKAQSMGGLAPACDDTGTTPCEVQKPSVQVIVPFIGTVNSAKYPLIALTSLLGFFDGFNPCAMWVLVTFLIMLLQVGSRRKMALFAGVFILAEAVMYTMILTVWYKTWNFVQMDSVITPIIGVVTIIGGIFFIREWRKKELECHVTDAVARHKTYDRLKHLAAERFSIFTFLGILAVAFSVNIIEFACSVGIPQSFTKILELNHVGGVGYMMYIFVYILFYMIDDFVVFGLALYGADKLSLTGKYSKISNLIGGIVMILLGGIMIIRPGLILF